MGGKGLGALGHRGRSSPDSLSLCATGVVGDWRSHFSPEQNALFNRRYQEEMGDTELPSQWPMA